MLNQPKEHRFVTVTSKWCHGDKNLVKTGLLPFVNDEPWPYLTKSRQVTKYDRLDFFFGQTLSCIIYINWLISRALPILSLSWRRSGANFAERTAEQTRNRNGTLRQMTHSVPIPCALCSPLRKICLGSTAVATVCNNLGGGFPWDNNTKRAYVSRKFWHHFDVLYDAVSAFLTIMSHWCRLPSRWRQRQNFNDVFLKNDYLTKIWLHFDVTVKNLCSLGK